MLDYLTIGANDVELSARFYDALVLPLGYEKQAGDGYLPDPVGNKAALFTVLKQQ